MDQPKYTDRNLYGESGHPQAWDVAQKKLGDCYLLAPMASLAFQQPGFIEQAIRYDAPTESFTVTLYQSQKTLLGFSSKPKAVDVTVSQADIQEEIKVSNASRIDPINGIEAVWPAVFESAYAKLSIKDGEALADGFAHIGNGGWPREAMYALTGEKAESVSDDSLGRKPLDKIYSNIDTALTEKRPIVLTTRAVEGAPNDGLVTNDKGAGHAYTIEGIAKDASGNIKITARNPWGHNMDSSHGVSVQSPTIDVDLKTILENHHLQQLDFGPKPRRVDGSLDADRHHAPQDEQAFIDTGDQYMDRLLDSLGDDQATGRSLHQLAQSPHGRAFRDEGQQQYQEILDQQVRDELARAQALQWAQQAERSGPVMSR